MYSNVEVLSRSTVQIRKRDAISLGTFTPGSTSVTLSSSLNVSNTTLWPEWNDQDVNAETWASHARDRVSDVLIQKPQETFISVFEDFSHNVPLLPPSVTATVWKRLLPAKGLVLYNESENLDIITPNIHLMHSKVMSGIMTSISMLLYLGEKSQFALEEPSQFFMPNTQDLPWKPWHHIYSLCKAGKDTVHKPVINPCGKYYVRLFYMGCWRRIVVDDRIPFDSAGHILLPGSFSANEIWPYILSKAILKIASLTWNELDENVDFSVVSCLTGWARQVIHVNECTMDEIWETCRKHVGHYDFDSTAKLQNIVSHSSAGGDGRGTSRSPSKSTSRKLTEEQRPDERKTGENPPVILMGILEGAELHEACVPWIHEFLILQTRDIALHRKMMRPAFKPWKKYRWLSWASKKGLIENRNFNLPTRVLKVYSPFKRYSYNFFETDNSNVQLHSLESIHASGESAYIKERGSSIVRKSILEDRRHSNLSVVIEDSRKDVKELLSTDKRLDQDVITQSSSKGLSMSTEPRSSTTFSSDVKSIARSTSKLLPIVSRHKHSPITESIDFCMWIDLYDTLQHITELHLYHKPSKYSHNLKVFDAPYGISFTTKSKVKKEKKKSQRGCVYYKYNTTFEKSRNDTVFLFMDSPNRIDLLLTLNMLPKRMAIDYLPSSFKEEVHPFGVKSVCTVFVESYDWRNVEVAEPIAELNTVGSASTLLSLGEGRRVLRLWITTKEGFVLQCRSNCQATVGPLDKMMNMMLTESTRMTQFVSDTSKTFSNLIHQYGKSGYKNAMNQFFLVVDNATVGKKARFDARKVFLDSVAEAARGNSPIDEGDDVVQALRVMFMDPKIGRQERVGSYVKRNHPDMSSEAEKMNDAALLIQAQFKLLVQRRMREAHNPRAKHFKAILVRLNQVNEVIFLDKKVLPTLMRTMFAKRPDIEGLFLMNKDLHQVVHTEEWKGMLTNARSAPWIPVCRMIFVCHGKDVICAFRASCPLTSYVVRVVDNDDHRELPRLLLDPDPYHFVPNQCGYTVFVYGWGYALLNKMATWSLQLITEMYNSSVHPCFKPKAYQVCVNAKPTALTVEQLSNYYLPKKSNLICRCLVKVKSRVLLSLRLLLSNCEAQFVFKVLDLNDEILCRVEGVGSAIIPVVHLEPTPSVRTQLTALVERLYVIEAFLLNDSWPLSEAEEKVVGDVKRLGMNRREVVVAPTKSPTKISSAPTVTNKNHRVRHSPSRSTRRKRSIESRYEKRKRLRDEGSLTPMPVKPCWILHTVFDVHREEAVVVEDRRCEEQANCMKIKWAENDTGRHDRGMELRKNFFAKFPKILTPGGNASISEDPVDDIKLSDFSPASAGRSLPDGHKRLDLSQFILQDDRETEIRTEESIAEEKRKRMDKIRDFKQYHRELAVKRKEFAGQQLSKNENLLRHYLDVVAKSRQEMTSVYKMRHDQITEQQNEIASMDRNKDMSSQGKTEDVRHRARNRKSIPAEKGKDQATQKFKQRTRECREFTHVQSGRGRGTTV